jgi:CBS domain-containing protein
MSVADLIRSRQQIYSIPEDMTVHEAARYLREKQIRSVGVTSSSGKLSGVISQADISDRVAAENKCPAWMRVSEIMTTDLVSVTPEMSEHECLLTMEKHGIYHLLVVDSKEKYLGMISISDLLKLVASGHKERADLLESFVFPQR